MGNKRRPLVIIVLVLAVLALLLGDVLTSFARAEEALLAAPAAVGVAEPGRIELAQNQPKKRRTLMDLLFGGGEEERPPPPVVEKPVVSAPAAEAAVPAKPRVDKAPGATRLMVFGDSMAVDVGRAIERFYADDPNLVVVTKGVGSSGFVRDDFFNWPGQLTEEIGTDSFDIAVVIIGINDRQPIGEAKPLTPEWTAAYSARVGGFVQQARAAGKPLVWIGLPPMEGSYGQAMLQINEIQRLAAFGGGAEFLDIFARFADENGKYTTRGPDLNGNQVRMRKDDGIHFSAPGADKVAFYLSQVLKTYYRGGGTVGIEVADALLGTDAQLMVRPPYQGLGQMKLLEVAGAVISLTHAPRRAAELVSAGAAEIDPVGFDLTLLVEAPVGRVDAFGVGRRPEAENPTGR